MVITFIAQSSITLSVIHQYNMVCLSLVPGTVAPGFSFKKVLKVGNILNASWKNPFLQRVIIRNNFMKSYQAIVKNALSIYHKQHD